jgi:hypothetical protein
MTIDVEHDHYVRVWTRDTVTWSLLSWEARAVLVLALRKADRAGLIPHQGAFARGLAAVIGGGIPVEVVERALAQLQLQPPDATDTPVIVATSACYVFPRFVALQESRASDKKRQREARARRRDFALRDSRMTGAIVTSRDTTSPDVTEPTETVTPCCAVLSDPEDPDQISDQAPSIPPLQLEVDRDLPRSPKPAKTRRPLDPVQLPIGEVVLALPCLRGVEYAITAPVLAEFRGVYPGVDVEQEARKARLWLLADPSRWKTLRGARRFLTSWIDRAQNQSRGTGLARGTGEWSRRTIEAAERDRLAAESHPAVDDRPPPDDEDA